MFVEMCFLMFYKLYMPVYVCINYGYVTVFV